MIEFLRRLWPYVRPYQFRLFMGLFCGVLFALAQGALMIGLKVAVDLIFIAPANFSFASQLEKAPPILRPLIDQLVALLPELKAPSSKSGLIATIMFIPLVMFVRGCFAYLNVYFTNWASVRAVADLRAKVFEHLQHLPLSFYSQAKTGDLISRITNDTLILYTVIGNSFAAIIKDPVTILCMVGLLLSQQPRLTLISIFVFPLCLVPIVIYGRKVRRSVQAMQTASADMTNLMHEAFTANRIVKAYNLQEMVVARFREITGRFVGQMMRTVRSCDLPSQMTEFFGSVGVALVFAYVVFVADRNMTAGDFLQFIGSIFLMYQPMKALSRLHNQIEQARAASQRVFDLLTTPNTIVETATPLPLRARGADVSFDDISFSYGDRQVLHQINLSVKSGQTVALVGASGSGKTTLTSLLLRFYDPQLGKVRIGGTDIRNAAVRDLRDQIALVTQDTILFNETIRANIRLGRPAATDAEVEEAAKHAYAYEFIMAAPRGFETMVGEKGVNLSGGQRQRVAIARAILKNAPILVLDEATSALDTESERAVQSALEELMANRTTICIAHRLSTIQKADLIVVLDQGRIVETGKHDDLLKQGGIYFKLYTLQFQT